MSEPEQVLLSAEAYGAYLSQKKRIAEYRDKHGCMICGAIETCNCWDDFPTDAELFGVNFVSPDGEPL